MNFRCLVSILFCAVALVAHVPTCIAAESKTLSFAEIREQIKNAGPEQLEQIEAGLSSMIRKNPKSVEAYLLRAEARISLDRKADAMADVTESLNLEPKNAKAYWLRGLIHMPGDVKEAVDDFDSAIKNGENSAGMYSNRGSAYLMLGQLDPALADFDTALEKDQNAWPARLMRLVVYQGKGESEKVKKDADTLLASTALPNAVKPGVYSHRGMALVKLEKYSEAVEDLTTAMNGLRGREKGRAAYARSVAYYKLGDKEKANADLALAVELKGVVANRTPDKVVSATRNLEEALKPLIAKARATYPEAKKRFGSLPNGYHFEVMTDLYDNDGKARERVFVQVDKMIDSESGNVVVGRLGSKVQLKDHKFGEQLEVKEKDILDWTIVSPDGTEEGNLIGKFIDNWKE